MVKWLVRGLTPLSSASLTYLKGPRYGGAITIAGFLFECINWCDCDWSRAYLRWQAFAAAWPEEWLMYLLILSFILNLTLHIWQDLVIGAVTVLVYGFLFVLFVRMNAMSDALLANLDGVYDLQEQLMHHPPRDITGPVGEEYSACLNKIALVLRLWETHAFGLTVFVPFIGSAKVNLFILASWTTVNLCECARIVFRLLVRAGSGWKKLYGTMTAVFILISVFFNFRAFVIDLSRSFLEHVS